MVEPSTDGLPFLVVYGAWLWPLALAGFLAAVVRAVHGGFARKASYRARVIAEGLDVGGDRCVRGRIGGSAPGVVAATLEAEAVAGTPYTSPWRADEVWIETAEGRIAIDGMITVVAGSHASAARNGVPPAVSDEQLGQVAGAAPWLHRRMLGLHATTSWARQASVAAGDEVVAIGAALERAPAGGAADYREGASVWRLRGPVRIAARTPRGAALRMRLFPLLVLLGLTGGATYYVMNAAGERWRRDCDAAHVEPGELGNTHACALAAAMPTGRAEALRLLLAHLDAHPVRDEPALRRLLGLAELAHGCGAVVERLAGHERYEELVLHARACGLPREERRALALQGKFEDAARVEHDGDGFSEGEALIAAGRWRDAAEWAEAKVGGEVAAIEPPGATLLRERQDAYYRCFAELLRHYGGDPGAAARLRTRSEAEGGGSCRPMLLELAAPDEQRALVAAAAEISAIVFEAMVFERLAIGRGLLADTGEAVERLVLAPERAAEHEAPIAWLIAADPPVRDAGLPPEARGAGLRWRAAAQLFAHDLDAAARTAAMADELAPRLPHLVAAGIALHTPQLELDVPFDSRDDGVYRLSLRAGRFANVPYSLHGSYEAALHRASRGDGEPLARELVGPYAQWTDGDVLAVWPRIQHHREAVRDQLVWSAPRTHGRSLIWTQVIHAAMRRSALLLAGAPAAAQRWDEIYRRFDAMLADRRRVVALILANP